MATKERAPQPPKIQLDLKKAQWINEELATSPNQSALAKKLGTDRTSLIRTLNLTRLAPAIKTYILGLEPDVRQCPLTKKRLRHLTTNPDPEAQKEHFKQLVNQLRSTEPQYIKLPPFNFSA